MDWQRAIEINHAALLRILNALVHTLGLTNGGMLTTLPYRLYRKALLIIRPAESALRRLIMLAAHEMELRGVKYAPRGALAQRSGMRELIRLKTRDEGRRLPSFNLIDPLKSFDGEAPDFASFGATFSDENSDEQAPYDRVDAAALGRRLLVLIKALASIPHQARQLRRWYVQRNIAYAQNKPHRFSPLHPGPALAYRKSHRHEIEAILLECHGLAVMTRSRPNSS